MSWYDNEHNDDDEYGDETESRDPDDVPDGDYEVTGMLELVTPDWIQICHSNGCVEHIGVQPPLPLERDASHYADGEITISYSMRTQSREQHGYARQEDVIEALGDRFKPAAWWTKFMAAEAERQRR